MTPKRFFYILAGLLIAMIAAGGAAYYYASVSLSDRTTALSQRLGDEQIADQQLNDYADLQKQYQRLAPLVPTIYNALPAQKDQTKLALQLYDIAAASNMHLDNLTFSSSPTPGPTSQTVQEGDVLAIPVTFQLHGSYNQLQQFLQKQEHLNRYTNMTSLDISGQGDDLSFSVALNAYMKP